MFERFTQEAREVLVRAQEDAREMRHNFIGTEHLLIGLEGTDAAAMLERLGTPIVVLRQAVLDVVGRGDEVPTAPPPFTPRAKKALELSLREALARDDKAIRPEHLLLGVAREHDGVACQVLTSAGITYDAISAAVGPLPKQPHRFWRRPAARGSGVLSLEGENFRITAEQADQIRRYLAGGPPPLPPEA